MPLGSALLDCAVAVAHRWWGSGAAGGAGGAFGSVRRSCCLPSPGRCCRGAHLCAGRRAAGEPLRRGAAAWGWCAAEYGPAGSTTLYTRWRRPAVQLPLGVLDQVFGWSTSCATTERAQRELPHVRPVSAEGVARVLASMSRDAEAGWCCSSSRSRSSCSGRGGLARGLPFAWWKAGARRGVARS